MILTIGTPHSGHFGPQYVNSLAKTLITAACSYEVLTYEGCYVHSSRNLMMENAQGDYLLFIDSDMCWEPMQIQRLLAAEKDVIGGLYYKRGFPYGPVVYDFDGITFKPKKPIPERLFRCDGIGTGFLLISRKVMDHFKAAELKADWGFSFDPIKTLSPGVAGSYYMGEDLSFCGKLNTLGYEIWCDPETIVKHVGIQEVGHPL
jgi:hypothetical protein